MLGANLDLLVLRGIKMFVYFSQLKEVESLEELPEFAIIKKINGIEVAGMCGVCDKPVFSNDKKVEENGNYWHKSCASRF